MPILNNNNLYVYLLLLVLDIHHVNIVVKKVVKDARSPMIVINNQGNMQMRLIKIKYNFNYIGEKIRNKYKRNLINFHKGKVIVNNKVIIIIILKKDRHLYKIVLNYFNNHKLQPKIMHGIVQIVKILYSLRNKCKFIKHPKY